MIEWAVLVTASILAGASLVALLVVRQRSELLAALFGAGAFVFAMHAVIDLGSRYSRLDAIIYALGFFVFGIGGGWSFASASLDLLIGRPQLPMIDAALPEPLAKAAVILVTCFEPEEYGPRETAGMLKSLSEEELLQPTITTMPFMFFAQKARYRAIGSASPARSQMVHLAKRLQAALGQSPIPSVTWANCSGRERLASRVAEAVNRGHRRIVVCPLMVGESLHVADAKREVDSLRLDRSGVEVTYTRPLADSEPITALVARRAFAAARTPETAGVVLVGHGQPDARAQANPGFDEDEAAFMNRVRLALIEDGIAEKNVRVAWNEWRQPDVTSTIRHLAALGCQRIVVVPAVFPLDGLTTRLDLDVAVRQARLSESVTCVTMRAWEDDEQVVGELARRVAESVG